MRRSPNRSIDVDPQRPEEAFPQMLVIWSFSRSASTTQGVHSRAT